MRVESRGELRLSPSDLSGFLDCRHRTGLELAAAHGVLARPSGDSAVADALRQRGLAHERAYVDSLRADGLAVVEIDDGLPSAERVARTLHAMRAGAPVIVQAALANGAWLGYADVLRRVPAPSALGAWSYEPCDTKLARDTRGATILQLAEYVHLLEAIQQARPERFHVVSPGRDGTRFLVSTYRYADFAAYVRLVGRQFQEALALGHETLLAATYPEPVDHCDVCRWFDRCHARRRSDDHLSFIAGAARIHREELTSRGYPTLAAAAAMPLPIPFAPARGSRDTYGRLREQARLQHEQRTRGAPVHELLPVAGGRGLARLPEPSPGDVFLDLEGARFAREGGREYLFGLWAPDDRGGLAFPGYEGRWAFTDADERAAFETVLDRITRTLDAHPGAHVYHFGQYEPAALKRLMGRHATRADALDALLRGERFVDLHAVVRQALRAGVERYSIKQLEQFYGFSRAMPLRAVTAHLQAIELALESDAPSAIPDEARDAVQSYNQDDCRSAEALRGWLERLRAELEAAGRPVPRPVPKSGEAPREIGELEARQLAMRARLLDGLPDEASTSGHPDHARWLLAYLLDWHRREEKSAWWEFYRLRDLAETELFDEPKAIAGLEFIERVHVVTHKRTGRPTGSVVDRYSYPAQEMEVPGRGELSMPGGEKIGDLVALDRFARTIELRKGPTKADTHPAAVFEGSVVPTVVLQEALLRFAAHPDAVTCGTDLLHRRVPRLLSGAFADVVAGTDDIVDAAVRLATALDRTTLAIQGPPGAGKTYAGARMIRALVRAGKKVGVTAASHKVIRNLLEAVLEQERDAPDASARPPLRLGQKGEASSDANGGTDAPAITPFEDNADALDALASGGVDVLGGTSWLWSRPEAAGAADVLFVDEAGQMSLANALAVSGAAKSLVLLGDPQQLEQPQTGTHPDGVGISALEHVLDGAATMPADRGLFLPTTWRLHPSICAFTSELFYEGRLMPKPGLERQALAGTGAFDGAGLWWVPVEHAGNQNASIEEVNRVEEIVQLLLGGGVWTGLKPGPHVKPGPHASWSPGEAPRPLTPGDLRIVAPYSAQVNRLADRLAGRGVPVGTVDRFQGQEAPVVIYSMATSRPEDAPRGMEFLYSLNRLNVATSRARCAAILVASPALLEPSCRTPRQMRLANALCRFRELARAVP